MSELDENENQNTEYEILTQEIYKCLLNIENNLLEYFYLYTFKTQRYKK